MPSIVDRIVNFDATDFHMHTSSFSDGMNTIQEMLSFAGKIWLTEIAITDHSDACRKYFETIWIYASAGRWDTVSYKDLENHVKLSFGVEWDLLDPEGNSCFTIQWKESDFCILSAHKNIYQGSPNTITDATIQAIEKYGNKIKFIWHPTCNNQFWKYYDMEKLVKAANKHGIALEINAKSIANGNTHKQQLDIMLRKGNSFYFNSDAHNITNLQEYRIEAAKFLEERWYIRTEEYRNFIKLFTFVEK